LLLEVLLTLLYIGLVVYSAIDCIQTPGGEIHRLSRGQWIAAILIIPGFGAVCWLMFGRAGRGRHERARSGPGQAAGYGWTEEGLARHPVGPDDDPDFLAGLAREQRERKRLLTRQEEDRRRRERTHRRDEERPAGPVDNPDTPPETGR